jgi:Ca2+-binding RTX toxin-like protein
MLGRVQLADLKRDLLESQRNNITWKFIIVPEPIQNLGVAIAGDRFEGYAAERTEILKFINDNKITNVVFVTADFHGTLVNNLTYQTGPGTAQIPTGAWEIITGSVAYNQPFGQTVANFFLNSGQRVFYNSLPIANDADSILNDKDDFIKQVVNGGINALGYDPIGLNDNLSVANGLINANLLQGDYIATHTYGWTEFNIDQVTQKLTVTTYGIDAYSRGELEANPNNIVSRQPRIVSQFEVDPNPKLSINDVKVVEGLDRKAFVTVVLSGGGSSQTVNVNYSTNDGTAKEGTNYTKTSGVITFNPGETTKTISVAIANNSIVETDRNFTISLSNPVGVAIADSTATVTITDTLVVTESTVLAPGVENLTLTGTANINGTGNSNNNTITGNSGNNILNGGTGKDTLIGGVGNDTYIIDNILDVVTEALNGGIDLIQSSVTYTLGDNVENLTLTGTALIGTGNSLNNTITGNNGNNTLDGGAGVDILDGGAGNDTYIVDSTTDTITDSAGTDTIQSSVDLSLVSYATIENLNLTGTAMIGTGNSLNNTITGNSGNNTLNGGGGNDTLIGGTGNDTYLFSITTSVGTDTITEAVVGGQDTIDLTGTTAAIRLNLGITTAQTLVANGSKLTLTAANAIENVIAGAGADRIIGNDLDNRLVGRAGNDALTGGAGNDTLVGGAGNDILTGGTGNDFFGFEGNAAFTVASQGLDTIQDFTPGNDQISLSKSVFAFLTSVVGQGFSVASEFAVVEDDDLAGTSNGLIVYSSSSGSLFYNQNSTDAGFGTGGEFAILATAPTLTANNFSLV